MTVIALSRCVHQKDRKWHQHGANSLLYCSTHYPCVTMPADFIRLAPRSRLWYRSHPEISKLP